ncbi:hypothetical protein DFH94DRAFT_682439 [Russula ochroleuca]|uniref:Uncharacterized protein n=1 Tax=Russula ochroleuca TaxID=152965 RepID=A0A9P5MVQ5_9AGAM|nr:hypothetical protein DFH94DRAFT_682439 [Russula ochroleuca]
MTSFTEKVLRRPGIELQVYGEISRLREFIDAALQDYEKQTSIRLAEHPLATQLQNGDSVDRITAVLDEQLQAFSKFRGVQEVTKLLKNTASVLYKLSATADLNQAVGLPFPVVKPIFAALAVLLSILVELLSILALATRYIMQGRFKKLAKELLGEKSDVVLRRLNRLTREEARMTEVQIAEVMHRGLIQNSEQMHYTYLPPTVEYSFQ